MRRLAKPVKGHKSMDDYRGPMVFGGGIPERRGRKVRGPGDKRTDRSAKRGERDEARKVIGRSNPRAPRHIIPPIVEWNTYAGGTSAAPGRRAYDFYPTEGKTASFSIQPVSYHRDANQHMGYKLTAFGIPPHSGHVAIAPDGFGDHNPTANLHRSPLMAVYAARKFYDRVTVGGKVWYGEE